MKKKRLSKVLILLCLLLLGYWVSFTQLFKAVDILYLRADDRPSTYFYLSGNPTLNSIGYYTYWPLVQYALWKTRDSAFVRDREMLADFESN